MQYLLRPHSAPIARLMTAQENRKQKGAEKLQSVSHRSRSSQHAHSHGGARLLETDAKQNREPAFAHSHGGRGGREGGRTTPRRICSHLFCPPDASPADGGSAGWSRGWERKNGGETCTRSIFFIPLHPVSRSHRATAAMTGYAWSVD